MADEPGPQTIQVRAALTQAQGANVPLNTMTTVVPQLRLLTTVGGLATDALAQNGPHKPITRFLPLRRPISTVGVTPARLAALVGSASIEIEGRDEITDRLLVAAVDSRAGQKSVTTMLSKWADVQAAASFWGKQVADFFARQGVDQKG